MTAVSGDILTPSFSVERLLTRQDKETWDSGNGPANFWLGPSHTPATFIINLGCSQTFKGIELVNTHTATYKDRATKQFRYKNDYLHFYEYVFLGCMSDRLSLNPGPRFLTLSWKTVVSSRIHFHCSSLPWTKNLQLSLSSLSLSLGGDMVEGCNTLTFRGLKMVRHHLSSMERCGKA